MHSIEKVCHTEVIDRKHGYFHMQEIQILIFGNTFELFIIIRHRSRLQAGQSIICVVRLQSKVTLFYLYKMRPAIFGGY